MNFSESSGWRKIATALTEQIEFHREAALEARSFEAKEYERGWYDALRAVLELPSQILKEENDEKTDQEKTHQEENLGVRVVSAAPPPRFSKRF